MKNILITGGGGYVGTVLVEKLLKLGHKVTVIDLFLYGDYLINKYRNKNNFKCIKGDIRNLEDCTKAVGSIENSVDYILHQAALGSVPLSNLLDASDNKFNFLDPFLITTGSK